MAKKSHGSARRTDSRRSFPPLLLIGGIALVVIAVAAMVWVGLSPRSGNGGAPQLQVSSERLDLGKQVFDRNVRASFEIKNTGTGTLTLQVPRVATALEGC